MSTPLQQLTEVLEKRIAEASALTSPKGYDDLSDLPDAVRYSHLTGLIAAIERVAGKSSVYAERVKDILDADPNVGRRIKRVRGVAESLKQDIADGMLSTAIELIHGELFADFIEMAHHLLDSGYKDGAAVIAGSALESHLRQLATKHGISNHDTNGKSKKADLLNAELAGAVAYSKLDQKSVLAWLDLRNKAAHGCYSDYQKEQVALLISGVRDFIIRSPA